MTGKKMFFSFFFFFGFCPAWSQKIGPLRPTPPLGSCTVGQANTFCLNLGSFYNKMKMQAVKISGHLTKLNPAKSKCPA